MAQREITDEMGRVWQVWDVTPGAAVKQELRDGWLTFETAREKRRLSPPPDGWDSCCDADLLDFLGKATAVQPSRRLIE